MIVSESVRYPAKCGRKRSYFGNLRWYSGPLCPRGSMMLKPWYSCISSPSDARNSRRLSALNILMTLAMSDNHASHKGQDRRTDNEAKQEPAVAVEVARQSVLRPFVCHSLSRRPALFARAFIAVMRFSP